MPSPSPRICRQALLPVPMHVQCRQHPTELHCVITLSPSAYSASKTLLRQLSSMTAAWKLTMEGRREGLRCSMASTGARSTPS